MFISILVFSTILKVTISGTVPRQVLLYPDPSAPANSWQSVPTASPKADNTFDNGQPQLIPEPALVSDTVPDIYNVRDISSLAAPTDKDA